MPDLHTDQPADSSELEAFRGYPVGGRPEEASGGPPLPPLDGLIPLSPGQQAVPVLNWHRRDEPRSVRRLPWRSRSILCNTHLAAMFVVPSLCYLAVWALAQI